MEQQKIHALINYLSQLGFRGEQFQRNLVAKINAGGRSFRIDHAIRIDQRIMFYDLSFVLDRQFESYRLSAYTATLRQPVIINYIMAEDIDTGSLEKEMAGIDWENYFEDPANAPLAIAEAANKITDQLAALSEKFGEQGTQIKELLLYQYWPRRIFQQFTSQPLLPQQFESSRGFAAGANEMASAELAFYYVSGIIDKVLEQLKTNGLYDLSREQLKSQVEKQMLSAPGCFSIKCSTGNPDYFAAFEVLFHQREEDYQAEEYSITLTPLPEIKHGVYNGVDTAALEKTMQAINWNYNSDVSIPDQSGHPVLLPDPAQVLRLLEQLQTDVKGKDIAGLLNLKYWSNDGLMSSLITGEARQLLEQQPSREFRFPIEINVHTAILQALKIMGGEHVAQPLPADKIKTHQRPKNPLNRRGKMRCRSRRKPGI